MQAMKTGSTLGYHTKTPNKQKKHTLSHSKFFLFRPLLQTQENKCTCQFFPLHFAAGEVTLAENLRYLISTAQPSEWTSNGWA